MEISQKFNKSNTIYKIVNDIDLSGQSLSIPANCILDFQGGKILSGTLSLNNTGILPNGCVISDYITAEIVGTYRKGQCLYDEVLNKPKWWTGSHWVDATGSQV